MDENSKGGNVGTRQINSQRKDPRTFEAPVKRWRVQKKRKEKKRKRKKKKQKAQKKPLVDKGQRTVYELTCVGKERRRCEGKRRKEEQES